MEVLVTRVINATFFLAVSLSSGKSIRPTFFRRREYLQDKDNLSLKDELVEIY